MNNKGTDHQTAQMRRLICTFVVRMILHKQALSCLSSNEQTQTHPAGAVTGLLVNQRNMTPNIGDAKNKWRSVKYKKK